MHLAHDPAAPAAEETRFEEFLKTDIRVGTVVAAHDFPELADMVRVRRGLVAALRQLPGRKILVTNAPRDYALAVMRVAGIERCFERVVAIEDMWVHGHLRRRCAHPGPAAARRSAHCHTRCRRPR